MVLSFICHKVNYYLWVQILIVPLYQQRQTIMTTQAITTKEIFQADQILTLEIAKTLIGKKIAVTSPEYRGNSASVRTGTVLGIESEWDLASKEDHSHLDNGKWATRQDYWKSYMGPVQIEGMQNNLKIVSDGLPLYCTCDLKDKWSFNEPTFFGSDSDREIYYLIIG